MVRGASSRITPMGSSSSPTSPVTDSSGDFLRAPRCRASCLACRSTRPTISIPACGSLAVGNAYDHKDVARTIELLTVAFPFEPIVALGPAPAPTPRVTVFESGTLSEIELHRLYADSRAVVFPSFYEGFGLPIVTTLAYGGTLLARRSALLSEIAG